MADHLDADCLSSPTTSRTMIPARLDLVVFGASGYTGRFVVTELVRISEQHPGLTWAVAGRSQRNLEALLQEVSNKTGVDLSTVRTITADVGDEASLRVMCCQAKLILNCCGSFVKLGEPVVAMSVACKSHYVDVSGEQQFFEIIERKYDQAARTAGVYVITSCGLSSIPADLGVIYLEDNFKGTLKSVESYLTINFPQKLIDEQRNGVVRYSTWESMINSLSSMPVKKLVQKFMPAANETEFKKRSLIHRNLNRWCLPFPGTDAAIVSWTQRHLLTLDKKHPLQYKSYITFPSILTTMIVVIVGALLFLLSKISLTRNLLLNYPRICSIGRVTHGYPKAGVMDDMCFQYEMFGEGWKEGVEVETASPNEKIRGRVTASGRDPAYAGTAVAVIYAALTILKEQDKLPRGGGVLTPGAAFRNTGIIKKLQENNFKFDIFE